MVAKPPVAAANALAPAIRRRREKLMQVRRLSSQKDYFAAGPRHVWTVGTRPRWPKLDFIAAGAYASGIS